MKNRKEARVWDDTFDREFFTPEEISESDMRANIITAMIEEREAVGNGSCKTDHVPKIGAKTRQTSE